MLTRDAWNALLKILEEPPPRVIFVFATTDPGKIRQSASPVLSRVQRFDFRRVSLADLLNRLREVVDLEGVDAEQEALLPIARRAEGGVRDALSLLDQVLSFSGDEVTAEDVRRMLGLVEEERYLEFLGIAGRGDRAAVFPFVQSLLDEGYDLAEFVRGLGEALRLALALRMDPETGAAELAEESRTRLGKAAEEFREEDLLRMLVATADFESAGRYRRSDQPRIQVEVLLLRLASLDSSVTLTELLDALGRDDGETARRPAAGGKGPGPAAPVDAPADPGTRASGGPRAGKAVRPRAGGPAGPSGSRKAIASVEAPPPATDVRWPGQGPDRSGLRSAWADAITAAQGKGVGGRLLGLKGATVEVLDGTTVRLRVPAGLGPDLQAYLDDLRQSAAFRLELTRRLGLEEGSLRFQVEDTGPRQRITAEAARDQRLQGLMDTDPRLREAVETLDLKLKE